MSVRTLAGSVMRAVFPGWRPGRLKRDLKRQIDELGEAELQEIGNLVRPGDLCLDVGSNMGVYSYLLRSLGCRTVAFEPNPAMASRVRDLKMGIDVREVALSSEDGTATLRVPVGVPGLATLRSDAPLEGDLQSFTVPTRRLDDMDFENVAFIKIDVEGVEERVLEGAAETIARSKPALLIEIEERHNSGGLARIRQKLEGLGYKAYFLDKKQWRPVSHFDPARDQSSAGIRAIEEQGATQRSVRYINNFLFLPAGRSVEGIQ